MNTPSRPAAARARGGSSQHVPAPMIGRERRGVLLLIVLSMLTLFMMLGAAYLIVATRSRETAGAHAKLSLRNPNIRLPHSQIFDTVMLRVLRGVSTGTNVNVRLAQPAPAGVFIAPFESLLADKYGFDLPDASGNYTIALSGTAKGNPPVSEQAPVLVLPLVALDKIPPPDADGRPFAATDLAGRVLTILGTGRDPSSHRILRANDLGNSNYELIVDNQPRNRPYEPVVGQSCRVVINGREFSGSGTAGRPNESWDGFDDFNPFLAWVAPRDLQNETNSAKVSVSSSVVKKVGFVTAASDLSQLNSGTNGFSYGADNDNDGVNDGFFLDFGLPTVISPNGDQVTLHASVLVLDLDGRVNVNAHGSLVPVVYPHSAMSGTTSSWQLDNLPTGFPSGKPYAIPTGSGYGPPEVNLDLLFPYASSGSAATYDFERLQGTVTRGYPEENPLLYLRTGVNQSRLRVGRYPQKSRFYSRDSAGEMTSTNQIDDSEGRYGGAYPTRFSPTDPYEEMQLATGNPDRFFLPGLKVFNDAASAITDHRSPIDPATLTGSPRTVGYEGVPPLWWNVDDGKSFNWADKTTPFTGSPSLYPRATYNSPPDLHGRMKTFTVAAAASTGIVPQLCFVKPEWSRAGELDVETRDDPYEIRLDTRAPRNSWLKSYGLSSPNGNVFNLSELENILRPYDIDSSKLPPRLEAILGSVAEEARLRITTDSWDSTVVSGSAAPKLFDWARKLSDTLGGDAAKLYGATTARNKAVLDGVLNREIARGERFDLNRPLTGTKPAKYDITDPYYAQRQAYFKDLYVLLCALTPPADFNAKNCAQWVANIVEFRDGDSTMTPFEFDTNPADGWDVDGNVKTTNDAKPAQRDVVFGCERPEIVIAETCAWEDATTGELYVVLHRPWNATAFGKATSGDASVAAEPCDPQFDSYDTAKKHPLNALDLGRKSGATAANPANNANPTDRATLPVWRLRIKTAGQPDTYVRLDTRTAAGGQPEHVLADNTTPKLGVDTSICLKPQAASTVVTVQTQQQKLNVANFATLKVQGPAATFGAPDRKATIFLERLTDPTAAPDVTKPDWTQDPSTTAPSALTDSDGQLGRMAVYRVVDQQTVTVVNRTPEPVTMQVPPGKDPKTTRRKMDAPVDTFWKQVTAETTAIPPSPPIPLVIDANWTLDPNKPPKWFFWPNRPLVASPELLFVHALDSQTLLTKYSDPSPLLAPDPDTNNWNWGPTVLRNLKSPPLFDAVHVPTRFAGIHGTTSDPNSNLATLAGIDQVTTPVNQLSSFREPGRVNLNTVTADDVWNAVVAGPLVKATDGSPDPVGTRKDAALNNTPARNTSALFSLNGQQPAANAPQPMPKTDSNATLKPAIDLLNPSQAIYTANRLANTTTTKSHLFGVWITLREAMAPAPPAGQPAVPADPDGVRYHRAFYIIDRSIPVAHEPGRDHNVWDAVLLRRIVE